MNPHINKRFVLFFI